MDKLRIESMRALRLMFFTLIISTPLLANAEDSKAQTGLMFGLNVGYANGFAKESNVNAPKFSRTIKSGNVNFGGFVGYDYAVLERLSIGMEIGINYTPNIYELGLNINTVGNAKLKFSTLNIPFLLKVKLITEMGFNLFLKGGINYQRLSADIASCSSTLVAPTFCTDFHNVYGNNWRPVIAGGIGYQVKRFNIFAQYMYVFGNTLDTFANNKALAQGNITGGVSYILPI